MKYEWRKKDKALYLPKTEPVVIDVPPMNYLTITGEGNPNDEAFSLSVQALYAMAYGIRMSLQKGLVPKGYYEYTVFPLEGIWSLSEEGIRRQQAGEDLISLKKHFAYKLMIRQPEFVEKTMVEEVKTGVAAKKKELPIEEVCFESIDEGKAIQMMHVGSYDSETESFAAMEAYAGEMGLSRADMTHKEIYLTKPDDKNPDKQKTTLRFWVV